MNDNNKSGLFSKFLDWIEANGNKLPQPVTLFAIMICIVLLMSWIASVFGFSAVHPASKEEITAVNLLSKNGIQRMITEMITVFTSFPPLGLVLVVMLGIGVAERSGLVAALLKAFVKGVPKKFITIALITAGMLSSLAADAGYVVLIPLGAVIFYGLGRHPIAGLAAAFAGVSGGFSANLFLTSLDPLLAGFTEPAARILDETYTVYATSNYYLMAAMVPVYALVGTYVTEKIIEPRLGPFKAEHAIEENDNNVSPSEKKGLIGASLATFVILAIFAWMTIPVNGILRGEEGSFIPFFDSIEIIMLLLFLVPGIVFGIIHKSIKKEKDVADMMAASMSSMGAYIVLAFVAAQFVAYFNWSNIGIIFAISGAEQLKEIGFEGIPLLIAFIFTAAFINLLIGSASAKWAIMAPVFVPMLMQLSFSPELTQAAYRIGDSFTNILTPLLPYFPLIIVFAQKYVKNIGIGSIISVMVPYSIAFGIAGILMLVIWLIFGIPLGPDAPMLYEYIDIVDPVH